MDTVNLYKRINTKIGKYKYAVLILALGVLMMVFPQQKQTSKISPSNLSSTSDEISLSEQLENILCRIDRVGNVKVLLVEATGEEKVFQTNDTQSTSDSSSNIKADTVICSDSDRAQDGLVRKIVSPIYQGAIVVCQGGDDPSVKLAITHAVANVTGLGSNCISVLKMK